MRSSFFNFAPLCVLAVFLAACDSNHEEVERVRKLAADLESTQEELKVLREQLAQASVKERSVGFKNVDLEVESGNAEDSRSGHLQHERKLTHSSSRGVLAPLARGPGVRSGDDRVMSEGPNPLIRKVRTNRKLSDFRFDSGSGEEVNVAEEFEDDVWVSNRTFEAEPWFASPRIWSPLPWSSFLQPGCRPLRSERPLRLKDRRTPVIQPILTNTRLAEERRLAADRRVEEAKKLRMRVERRRREAEAIAEARREREEREEEARRNEERRLAIGRAEERRRLDEEAKRMAKQERSARQVEASRAEALAKEERRRKRNQEEMDRRRERERIAMERARVEQERRRLEEQRRRRQAEERANRERQEADRERQRRERAKARNGQRKRRDTEKSRRR